jgi:hypothetical protein
VDLKDNSPLGPPMRHPAAVKSAAFSPDGSLALTVTMRSLDPPHFLPDAVRLITRKAHGRDEPDLTDLGNAIVTLLREEAQHAPR